MSYQVGSFELVSLPDAVGELGELDQLYPGVPADHWEPYRALYAELFAGAQWRLPCACFLIRSRETTVLVDTGVGPPGLWGWAAEREGKLPRALDEHGVGRDDIDIVFLTHLHIDHLGWNTDESGAIFFPRARYLVHRDALAFVQMRAELPHVRRCVEPLLDRFETLDGETELAPGITAFAAPGHFPGHMGVRIHSRADEAVLLGDAAVHPALLDRPEWRCLSDLDPDSSIATRRTLLEELADRDVLVGCGHYPGGGIGRIVRRNGMTVWETE